MPVDLTLIKTHGGWANGDKATEDYHHKTRLGDTIHGKFTKMRRPAFHRKYMALLNLAFEYWEAPDLDEKWGMKPEKNFDRFRHDVAIMCGFCDLVIRLDGSTRVEHKSISFASMDQTEFEDLYSKTIDLFLKHIPMMSKMGEDGINEAVNNILAFT